MQTIMTTAILGILLHLGELPEHWLGEEHLGDTPTLPQLESSGVHLRDQAHQLPHMQGQLNLWA